MSFRKRQPHMPQPGPELETDPRFPSGRWTGFFLDRRLPGRHMMELQITFRQCELTGEGRDKVGKFVLRGRYDIANGQCHWTKRYLGKHDVFYQGYAEGKGIWGTWELTDMGQTARGGFHIWPEGESGPTGSTLAEAAEPPVESKEKKKELLPV